MRHKEFHGLNVPPALSFAVDFGLGLVSDKLRKRFNFYSKDEVLTEVDKSLLPFEYGGNKKMSDMIGEWIRKLMQFQ